MAMIHMQQILYLTSDDQMTVSDTLSKQHTSAAYLTQVQAASQCTQTYIDTYLYITHRVSGQPQRRIDTDSYLPH